MATRVLEGTGADALKVIESAVPELVSRFRATTVVLYGSYAHGTADRWSDIDIAVVSPHFGLDPVRETCDLIEFFEHVDLRVEPRAFSRDEWEHSKPGDFLYDEVREKGIVVFGA